MANACKRIFWLMASVVIIGCQSTPAFNPYQKADDNYLNFLAKVENKSHLTDFNQLRELYTATSFYSPLSSQTNESLLKAFKGDQYAECAQLASQHLMNHQVSLLGHYTGMVCNAKNGNDTAYLYHQYMLDGLMESVAASGDGTSMDSPFKIISKEEMIFYIDLNGLTLVDQNLKRKDDNIIDIVTVKQHPSHPDITLYFDLSKLELFHITSQLKQQ